MTLLITHYFPPLRHLAIDSLYEMHDIPLLIVSDDLLTRAGLAAVLASAPGIQVVGQSDSVPEPAELLDLYQPGLLLWDLGWDPLLERGSHEAAPLERLAAAIELGSPVVVLAPDETVAAAAWRLGAAALLLRSVRPDPLLAALQAAAAGLRVLDPALASALSTRQPDDAGTLVEPLTPRELEVLTLLAEGMTNRAIGRALQISEHTAKFHVQALMGKLDAQSRTEVVVRATRLGLLTL
jgi:two-component system, NarL family, nitrate/nitrite response regulator NarL